MKYSSSKIKLKPTSEDFENSLERAIPGKEKVVIGGKLDFKLVEFLINEFYRKKDKSSKEEGKMVEA